MSLYQNIAERLRHHVQDSAYHTRRAHPRRDQDRCIGMIDDSPMPVEDWSPGGVCVRGDTRMFSMGDRHNVELKFKLDEEIIEVTHTAHVVRLRGDKIAMKFAPLPRDVYHKFQRVIDHSVANEFVISQDY
jgi:hypothetical protein